MHTTHHTPHTYAPNTCKSVHTHVHAHPHTYTSNTCKSMYTHVHAHPHMYAPNACKSMHTHTCMHITQERKKLYVAEKSLPKIFSIHILACPEFVCQGGTKLVSFLNKINEEQIKKPRAICFMTKGGGTGEKNPHLPQDI